MTNKNIPELRFPEFEGEWERKKLGEVADVIMGQSPDGKSYNTNGIGTALINGPVEFTEKYPVKTKWTSKPTKLCQDKDILFCVRGSTTGRMNIANDIYCIGRGVAAIRANKKSKTEFIELLIVKNLVGLLTLTSGSTFFNLDSKSIKEFQHFLPTLPEQQKIASFLTVVDKKLNALKQKKTLLEQYKKGVMQKIFSQELRFKDENGEEFSEWKIKKVGDLGKVITGKTPSTTNLDLWNGEIQFVTPTDINENKYQYTTQRTIKEFSKTKILPTQSIMFTCIASIGKMSLSTKPCVTNQQINSIIPFKEFNNEFIFYSLLNMVDYIKSTQSSNTLPIINKTEFSKFEILVPCLAEQTKIANSLSAIDEKISNCQLRITNAEQWKKGLLQKMFC